jgi:hypothetical protein
MWRSRWAAIGAAIAVSLGAGGLFVAQAAPGPSESTIVTVTPERILDTRDPNNIGLAGPFVSAVSQKLKVTGSIATATGTKTVVPTGATGVLLNVTPVNPTANGFISIRPGDATGAATTSSLNFTTGVAGIVPNAVQVAVPTAGTNAGQIDITYDAYGVAGPTTDILIDVVGYMTSAGLQELVADVATKASKAEVDAALATKANVTIPVGQTVTGEFVYDSHQQQAGTSDDRFYVPFPAAAPVPLTATDILFKPGFGFPFDSASCTGTVSAPTAPPGKVCIYVSQTAGLTVGSTLRWAGLLPTQGFQLSFIQTASSGADAYLFATWAYTAPAASLTTADVAPPVIGEGKNG